MKIRTLLLAATIALPFAPVSAADAGPSASRQHASPTVLTAAQRAGYREVFAAIRVGDWAGASTKLGTMGEGPLHATARAELYLAKGSPTASLEQLSALLTVAPDLPKADQLARLAATRGATEIPTLPEAQRLIWQDGQPRRVRTKSAVGGDPVAAELEGLVQPAIVGDRPSEAEAYLADRSDSLSTEARTEFQQRIAWSYYLIGNDRDARRLADLARSGSGEWTVQAAWVSGLASWRMNECAAASDAFTTVGARSADPELVAAGHYWAARADMLCAKPDRVQTRLRTASGLSETFYGMLAAGALGIKAPGHNRLHDYRDAEWRKVGTKPNVTAAIALAEIGEAGRADEFVRHQARIGGAADHDAMLHLACDLDLPYTQFWLAHNVPRGGRVNAGARYPAPKWKPARGWRVDQSLVYAHALQESNFRSEVVSAAGAVGLMQVRPGTAGDIARARGESFTRDTLNQPASNLEYGQSYLEYLRNQASTGGLLPKVIAAFNAGPSPVAVWNTRAMDRGDPLLYIESIPYWETRGYVPIVLRNYWIYEGQAGKTSSSRQALAQGMWPKFPGMPGATAVRIEPTRLAVRQEVGNGSD